MRERETLDEGERTKVEGEGRQEQREGENARDDCQAEWNGEV